jgi:membrane-associated phospholipid phosphatase
MLKSISKNTLSFILPLILSFSVCKAQEREDSISISKPKKEQAFLHHFALPLSFVGLGVLGAVDNHIINRYKVRDFRNRNFPDFDHKADNYVQFAPIAGVYAMDFLGYKGVNGWKKQSIYFGKAQLIMMACITPLKKYSKVFRPDSSGYKSFPSGHTAQAFLAATFFQKEFGGKYPWASVGMYTLATGVGISRILNNRHWISDVLAGAGIGMASVELSYLLHRKNHSKTKIMPDVMLPSYKNGAMSCTAIFKL